MSTCLEDFKKSQAKKEVTEYKRMGIWQVFLAGYQLVLKHMWKKVDDMVGARRRNALEPHLLQGTLDEKIKRVK